MDPWGTEPWEAWCSAEAGQGRYYPECSAKWHPNPQVTEAPGQAAPQNEEIHATTLAPAQTIVRPGGSLAATGSELVSGTMLGLVMILAGTWMRLRSRRIA